MSSTNGTKCEETYCKDWEEQDDLKDWLRPVAGDESKVSCRFCECEMLAHYSVLQQHMATTRHKKGASPSASTSLTDAGLNVSKPSGMITSRIKLLRDGMCPVSGVCLCVCYMKPDLHVLQKWGGNVLNGKILKPSNGKTKGQILKGTSLFPWHARLLFIRTVSCGEALTWKLVSCSMK